MYLKITPLNIIMETGIKLLLNNMLFFGFMCVNRNFQKNFLKYKLFGMPVLFYNLTCFSYISDWYEHIYQPSGTCNI